MTDKPRSTPQHRRFFGLMKALYHHWPENQQFQPDSEEHLRAFLLVKSGHRKIMSFEIDKAEEAARLIPIIAAAMLHRYCWAWAVENGIKVCAPESIAYEKLPHKDACKVFDDVEGYVRTLGMDPDQLLEETEQAA